MIYESATSTKLPSFSKSALGFWRLHSWGLSSVQLLDLIKFSLDAGITTFDHADIYGNYTCEELFGEAIAGQSSLREKMLIVSKCGIRLKSEKRPENQMKIYDTSYKHILRSVDNSLKALKTDFLDVLLIHRPDPFMNADETARALNHLREAGKVLYFGVSNFTTTQFDLLHSRLDFPLVTNQIEISVMKTECLYNGVLDQCQQLRIQPMAWSPLNQGEIFGSKHPQAERLRPVLQDISEAHGNCGVDKIALAWLHNHPSRIVPVIGTGKPERIKRAVEAENIQLSREEWFMILNASNGFDIP